MKTTTNKPVHLAFVNGSHIFPRTGICTTTNISLEPCEGPWKMAAHGWSKPGSVNKQINQRMKRRWHASGEVWDSGELTMYTEWDSVADISRPALSCARVHSLVTAVVSDRADWQVSVGNTLRRKCTTTERPRDARAWHTGSAAEKKNVITFCDSLASWFGEKLWLNWKQEEIIMREKDDWWTHRMRPSSQTSQHHTQGILVLDRKRPTLYETRSFE